MTDRWFGNLSANSENQSAAENNFGQRIFGDASCQDGPETGSGACYRKSCVVEKIDMAIHDELWQ